MECDAYRGVIFEATDGTRATVNGLSGANGESHSRILRDPFFFRRYHAVMPRVPPTKPGASATAISADLPQVRVLRQFRQIFNAVKTHFRQVEKKVGLGGAQVWALGAIRDRPSMGMGDLAEALNIHQSTASNLVKGLVERGLVAVEKDETDRRAVKLQLLPAGAKVVKRSPGPFTGVLPEALAVLDEKTLARLEEDLARLIAALDADAKGADIPLADL